MTYATVPRIWEGETAAILATGPSLCAADVDACRGRVKVIAVKDAVRLAPWADCLYACGADTGRWWPTHGPALVPFTGLRYTLDPKAAPWAQVLKQDGETGLSTRPDALRTGRNSGYQAINLAVLLGARTILLLGFDLKQSPDGREYFFGSHPYARPAPPYLRFQRDFATLVEPLAARGVTIINCTRQTALTCFPMLTLREALA